MNGGKFISIVTSCCFLFSFVFAQPVGLALQMKQESGEFRQMLGEFAIPSSIGRVTAAKNFGSKKVVVNIQDLHCHPEVQRNISRILGLIDEKYQLQGIYVEGAYGPVTTGWLDEIGDRCVKKEVVESLVDQGRLTGAEYYSILKDRPDLIKGLEDEKPYKENILRLNTIIGRKDFFAGKTAGYRKTLDLMQARYFNRNNKRFNRLTAAYRKGDMSTAKYYGVLLKYAAAINGDPERYNNLLTIREENYPNIRGYLDLAASGRRLDYRRISRQLQEFMRVLKRKLPYSAYNVLLEKTGNFSRLDELYLYLNRICREYKLDIATSYPDLKRFLDYVDKARAVNPILLVREERKLGEEIRIGLARDISELEVSFAVDFFSYFEDYLNNRLTAGDYEYFRDRFDTFKTVWAKYAGRNDIDELSADFAVLDDYYRVNNERNGYFLKNLPGGDGPLPSPKMAAGEGKEPLLTRSNEVIVVVTGGYHTDGLERLLEDRGITCIQITPNVTQDTNISNEIYIDTARLQAKILSNALSTIIFSLMPGNVQKMTELQSLAIKYLEKADFSDGEKVRQAFEKAAGMLSLDIVLKVERTGDVTAISLTLKDRQGKEYRTKLELKKGKDDVTHANIVDLNSEAVVPGAAENPTKVELKQAALITARSTASVIVKAAGLQVRMVDILTEFFRDAIAGGLLPPAIGPVYEIEEEMPGKATIDGFSRREVEQLLPFVQHALALGELNDQELKDLGPDNAASILAATGILRSFASVLGKRRSGALVGRRAYESIGERYGLGKGWQNKKGNLWYKLLTRLKYAPLMEAGSIFTMVDALKAGEKKLEELSQFMEFAGTHEFWSVWQTRGTKIIVYATMYSMAFASLVLWLPAKVKPVSEEQRKKFTRFTGFPANAGLHLLYNAAVSIAEFFWKDAGKRYLTSSTGRGESNEQTLHDQIMKRFDEMREVYNENIPKHVKQQLSFFDDYHLRTKVPYYGHDRFLTETEADLALEYLGYVSHEQFLMLQHLRKKIKETDEYRKAAFLNIPVYFMPAGSGTELFWAGEEYAAGYSSGIPDIEQVRLYISLPLALNDANELNSANEPPSDDWLSVAVARHELRTIVEAKPNPLSDKRITAAAERDKERNRILPPDITRFSMASQQKELMAEISSPVKTEHAPASMEELNRSLRQDQWHSAALAVDDIPGDLRALFEQVIMGDVNGRKLTMFDMLKAGADEVIFAPYVMLKDHSGIKEESSVDEIALIPSSNGKRIMVIGTLTGSDAINTGEMIREKDIYEIARSMALATGKMAIHRLVTANRLRLAPGRKSQQQFEREALTVEREFLLALNQSFRYKGMPELSEYSPEGEVYDHVIKDIIALNKEINDRAFWDVAMRREIPIQLINLIDKKHAQDTARGDSKRNDIGSPVVPGGIANKGYEAARVALNGQIETQLGTMKKVYNRPDDVLARTKAGLWKQGAELRPIVPEKGYRAFMSEAEADFAAALMGQLSIEEFWLLQDLRKEIKKTGEYADAAKKAGTDIAIYFIPAKTVTELFWNGGQYAAGYVKYEEGWEDEAGRLNIYLPLSLALKDIERLPEDSEPVVDELLSTAVFNQGLRRLGLIPRDPGLEEELDRRIREIAGRDRGRKDMVRSQKKLIVKLDDNMILEMHHPETPAAPFATMSGLHRHIRQHEWHGVAVSVDNVPSDIRRIFESIRVKSGTTIITLFDILKASVDTIVFTPHLMVYEYNIKAGFPVLRGEITLNSDSLSKPALHAETVPDFDIPDNEEAGSGSRTMIIGTLSPTDALNTGEEYAMRDTYDTARVIAYAMGKAMFQRLTYEGGGPYFLPGDIELERFGWLMEQQLLQVLLSRKEHISSGDGETMQLIEKLKRAVSESEEAIKSIEENTDTKILKMGFMAGVVDYVGREKTKSPEYRFGVVQTSGGAYTLTDKQSKASFTIMPKAGNAITSFMIGNEEQLHAGQPFKSGDSGGIQVMTFGDRVRGSKIAYEHGGRRIDIDLSDKKLMEAGWTKQDKLGTVYHGLGRKQEWKVEKTGVDENGAYITSSFDYATLPAELRRNFGDGKLTVTHRLKGNEIRTSMRSTGFFAPLYHPWFLKKGKWFVQVPADKVIELDDHTLPLGIVNDVEGDSDKRRLKPFSNVQYVLTDLKYDKEGYAVSYLYNSDDGTLITMKQAHLPAVTVWNPDGASFGAIEAGFPPDAMNYTSYPAEHHKYFMPFLRGEEDIAEVIYSVQQMLDSDGKPLSPEKVQEELDGTMPAGKNGQNATVSDTAGDREREDPFVEVNKQLIGKALHFKRSRDNGDVEPASPAIMKKHERQVQEWINAGKAYAKIAGGVAKLEYKVSTREPGKFVDEHARQTGARTLVAATKLSGAAGGLAGGVASAVLLAQLPVAWPVVLGAALAGTMAGFLSGRAAGNLATHAVIIYHFLKANQVREMRGKFGGVADLRLQDGEIFPEVILLHDVRNIDDVVDVRALENTGLKVMVRGQSKTVWISAQPGMERPLLYIEGITYADGEEVARQINHLFTGAGKLKADGRAIRKFIRFLNRMPGVAIDAEKVKVSGMAVDYSATAKLRYLPDGSPVIPARLFAAGNTLEERVAMIKMLGNVQQLWQSDAYAFGRNNYLHIDNTNSFEGLVAKLDLMNIINNAQRIIREDNIKSMSNGDLTKIIDLAKKSGVQLYVAVEPGRDVSRYAALGFDGYAVIENGEQGLVHNFLLGPAKARIIQGYRGDIAVLRQKIRDAGAVPKIYRISELEAIQENERVLWGSEIAGLFGENMRSLFTPRTIDDRYVRDAAWGIDTEQLPPVDRLAAIEAAAASDDPVYEDGIVGLFMERLAVDIPEKEAERVRSLRKTYLTAVAERLRAKALLEAAGYRFGLADRNYERLLAEVIAIQNTLSAESRKIGPDETMVAMVKRWEKKGNAAESYAALHREILALKASLERAQGKEKATLIGNLIFLLLKTEPKAMFEREELNQEMFNAQSIGKVLAAA